MCLSCIGCCGNKRKKLEKHARAALVKCEKLQIRINGIEQHTRLRYQAVCESEMQKRYAIAVLHNDNIPPSSRQLPLMDLKKLVRTRLVLCKKIEALQQLATNVTEWQEAIERGCQSLYVMETMTTTSMTLNEINKETGKVEDEMDAMQDAIEKVAETEKSLIRNSDGLPQITDDELEIELKALETPTPEILAYAANNRRALSIANQIPPSFAVSAKNTFNISEMYKFPSVPTTIPSLPSEVNESDNAEAPLLS